MPVCTCCPIHKPDHFADSGKMVAPALTDAMRAEIDKYLKTWDVDFTPKPHFHKWLRALLAENERLTVIAKTNSEHAWADYAKAVEFEKERDALKAENERLEKVRDAWVGKSERQRIQLTNERLVSELLNETNKELRTERDVLQEKYSSLSEYGRQSDHERIAELEQLLSIEAECIAEISNAFEKRDNARWAREAKHA